jgi:hypothetical protein
MACQDFKFIFASFLLEVVFGMENAHMLNIRLRPGSAYGRAVVSIAASRAIRTENSPDMMLVVEPDASLAPGSLDTAEGGRSVADVADMPVEEAALLDKALRRKTPTTDSRSSSPTPAPTVSPTPDPTDAPTPAPTGSLGNINQSSKVDDAQWEKVSFENRTLPQPQLSTWQRDAVFRPGPFDHYACLTKITRDPAFQLEGTIFKNTEPGVVYEYLTANFDYLLFWKKECEDNIGETDDLDAIKVMRPHYPSPLYLTQMMVPKGLLTFMETKADFSSEHVHGSFMDHLMFGYIYAYRNFHHNKFQGAPTVLFIHSIMGVAVNMFPIQDSSSIDELREILPTSVYSHVEAFPSFLRLLYTGVLFEKLDGTDCKRLSSVRVHRVVDNAVIEMSIADMWVALNFQAMHLVDFVPASNWNSIRNIGDPFLSMFKQLLALLQKNDKLFFDVDFIAPQLFGPVGPFPTWSNHIVGELLQYSLPPFVKMFLFQNQVRDYSKEIQHSLDMQLA